MDININPVIKSAHAGFLRVCGIERFRTEMGREPTAWEIAEADTQTAVRDVQSLEREIEQTSAHLAVLEVRLERAQHRMAMKVVEREEAALAELAANAPTPEELMTARITGLRRTEGAVGDEVVFTVPSH